MSEFTISPSRASDFKTCPALYKYRAIDRLPEAPTEPATRGTIVHLTLERLFAMPRDDRSVATAIDLLRGAWADTIDSELSDMLFENDPAAERSFGKAKRCIENYFDMEDPTRFDPIGRELKLAANFGRIRVRGIIDRLDRSGSGDWIVSDYKTGRTPNLARSAGRFFGLDVYAVLVHAVFGIVPTKLRLLYLDTADTYVLEPTRSDVAHTRRLLEALGAAIIQNIDRDEWPARRNGLCRVCSYQDICPSWSNASTADDSPRSVTDMPNAGALVRA